MAESEDFLDAVRTALREGSFVSLVLSKPRGGSDVPNRLDVRFIQLKQEAVLQWTHQRGKQAIHENVDLNESATRIVELVPAVYRDALLVTSSENIQLRTGKRKAWLTRTASSKPVEPQSHDRQKQYLLSPESSAPFLVELGLTSADGQIKAKKQKKFRQINRYLDFVNDIYDSLPAEGCLNIVDFGCGLSYLTFALYHFLTEIHGRQVSVHGIDRNVDVITRAQSIADGLGLNGLSFSTGEIADVRSLLGDEPVHLVVSLHACDTATDDTLCWAVQQRASVILAVPCCQHELASQLEANRLQLLTEYGIVREKFASLATDTLRAAALEANGYSTQIVEFIDLEHTAKNLLIRAVRRTTGLPESVDSRADEYRQRYEEFKQQLGNPTLRTDSILALGE
ncbi:MAG: SAM-dependent methyltransferase [Planctomycetaceae bacterium]|nr:SAM-dependent methyltransferase [Planctomycetaceae bacterium]MCB9952920.1 SAM-dependent methyltransferase [Planctomycetaceae bacterium]